MSFVTLLALESKAVVKDKALMMTIILGVILYAFMYPLPYSKGSVTELKVAFIDKDNSVLSRKLSFMLDASPQIQIIKKYNNLDDIHTAIQQGSVMGLIIIEKDFYKKTLLNQTPQIYIGADASYFLIYSAIAQAAAQTVLTQSAELKVKKLLLHKESLSSASQHYSAFDIKTLNTFNQDNSYVNYVVPAVFILILQQTLLIGMGILGGGQNESRNKESYFLHVSTTQLMLAKSIIFFTIFAVNSMFYLGFALEFYNIPHLANLSDVLILLSLFLVASIMLGILFGVLLDEREKATPFVLFSSLPLIFGAGFIWPIEALPQELYSILELFPSTQAIQAFLKLNQMGADFSLILPHIKFLLIQITLFASMAYYLLERKKKPFISK